MYKLVITMLTLLSPTIVSADNILYCQVENYKTNFANMEELNIPDGGFDVIQITTDSVLYTSEFEFDGFEMSGNRITSVDIEQGFVDINMDTGYVNFLDIDQWKVFKGGECKVITD